MLIVLIFALGYAAIVLEHTLGVNKAASALLCGVGCWTAYILAGDHHAIGEQLVHHMGELSGILFFLLSAMTIVELIDAHDGFELITSRIRTKNRRRLLVTISLLSFFLSAVLDNLTTSIVMMSLIRKLMDDDADRMIFGGVVVIAANAGGAWSPIGDITTTMLWVGGQLTTGHMIPQLIVPSLVSMIVPVLWFGARFKGDVVRSGRQMTEPTTTEPVAAETSTTFTLPDDAAAIGRTLARLALRAHTGCSVVTIARDDKAPAAPSPRDQLRAGDALVLSGSPDAIADALTYLISGQTPKKTTASERAIVLATGTGMLLMVPVFKSITHLPPFMGILLGLGVLWMVTELIHKRKPDEDKGALSVAGALRRVDAQSVLFFLGILLAITALQSAGLLGGLAARLDETIGNVDAITLAIGLSSAVVDNVPLVAAAQGMYATAFPVDHHFWTFLAYCAGTGGSILIIGSAAGVAVMGMQRMSFGWYVRKISLPALLGYAAGAAAFLALQAI